VKNGDTLVSKLNVENDSAGGENKGGAAGNLRWSERALPAKT
jgi:hypothetical protein